VTPAQLRALVPAASESAYLDTATYGPAAEPTVAAIRDFTDAWSRGATRFETWDGYVEDGRRLFASLINAPAEDIALTPFVSTGAGSLAVQLQRGDRVVVNEIEFGSNLWPWLFQRDRGVEVALVAVTNGRCRIEDYEAAIGERVTLVAVSALQSSNGWRAPLRRLADLAHRAGGMLFVDACQGAGAIRLDPASDAFDILAADSYKWLMGPRGAGYMYLSPAARDRFRPVLIGPHAGRNRLGSYYGPAMELSETASRFDSSPSWISMAGDREALALLSQVGVEVIEAHDLALAARFRAGAEELDLAADGFPEEERSPIVSLGFDDPDAAAERLAAAGVVVARRATGVRFSFHAFNNASDVDRALEALS
jgi:selenocysteine lyase/cysteine desulfurase